tara:strand:+ start:80 stop:487 length:408 start_codon:yes stop_codon:yes gene_type:complete
MSTIPSLSSIPLCYKTVKKQDKNHGVSSSTVSSVEVANPTIRQDVLGLEYKSNWYGGTYGQIDPKYTSQRCSVKSCGHKAKENRENQAKFLYKKCGHEENADINAAKNILAAGLAVFAYGGKSSDSPKKQEPLAA